jgi:hypothetical protein
MRLLLGSDCHVRTLCGIDGGRDGEERRANDDLVAVVSCDQRQKLPEELPGLIGRLVHFPIGGNYLFSHGEFLSMFSGDMAPDLCNFSKALM